MKNNIYFMEYVKHNFPNLEELLNVLKNKSNYKECSSLEQIFDKVNTYSNIREIFNTHITWSTNYRRLGFMESEELQPIHRNWQIIVSGCLSDGHKVLFKKNIDKLKINFE